VPIVWPQSILDIDDMTIVGEVVDDASSPIYSREFAIGNIDPCLSSSDIGQITRYEEYIPLILMILLIGYHRIFIREYDESRSAPYISLHDCWSHDRVLDYMYLMNRILRSVGGRIGDRIY
jgi:hypothetical protein